MEYVHGRHQLTSMRSASLDSTHVQITIRTRTLPCHMWGTLSIRHIFEVSCSELCNLIGVLRFLDGYTPDVHGSPDPVSLFLRRRGWRARLSLATHWELGGKTVLLLVVDKCSVTITPLLLHSLHSTARWCDIQLHPLANSLTSTGSHAGLNIK